MRTVSISDRYEATEGTVLLSGIEALVRLLKHGEQTVSGRRAAEMAVLLSDTGFEAIKERSLHLLDVLNVAESGVHRGRILDIGKQQGDMSMR